MENIIENITIDPTKTALLVLHWQNELIKPDGKLYGPISKTIQSKHIIENTLAALKASRNSGIMVVYVNACHRPNFPEMPQKPAPLASGLREAQAFIVGTWGTEVIDELAPLNNEIILTNSSTSAFFCTELDMLLRNRGVTDIVLSGIATNWVVESTARDAFNRGYFVYTLSDCCYGSSDEAHNYSLTNVLPLLGAVVSSMDYCSKVEMINNR